MVRFGQTTFTMTAPAAVAVLYAVVVGAAPFLPFVDLPQHVAAAQLLLHRGDSTIASTYEFALFPATNVLGLFVMAPLHAVLPEAAALRVFWAVYLGALAFALSRLARATGGSEWSAALAMLGAFNYNVAYGFVSFCLGIPILVLLMSRWSERLEPSHRSSRRELLVEAVLWWLSALAHLLVFAFALVALGMWLLLARRVPRLPRLIAMLPALAWTLGCALRLRAAVARTSPGDTEVVWHGLRPHLAELGRALGVVSASGVIEWSVLAIVAALVAADWVRERRARTGMPSRRFALPFSIYDSAHVSHGVFLLYARFLALLPLFWLPAVQARGRRLVAVVCILHVATAANWNTMLRRAGRQARGLDGAIAALDPYPRVKSLIYEPVPQGLRFEGLLHVASLHQARARGETDQSFALIPANPVRYRDPRRPYLSRQDEHLAPEQFDWRRARMYDAILLYDPKGIANARGPFLYDQNGWRVVAIK
jgi:hypothetical protein